MGNSQQLVVITNYQLPTTNYQLPITNPYFGPIFTVPA
ncbi:MAG: hypothetical protein CLLPBCKN_001709 [Chroococcidiopsis cubana SAG 39.79]|nr:hypothetical protein [Chroococcidiopsis cubana SAG 39.79]